MLDFCPNCGKVLKLNKSAVVLQCPKCGYTEPVTAQEIRNPARKNEEEKNRTVAVVGKDEESKLRTFPTVKATCPLCGAEESETWTVTVGSDGTTQLTFLRCTSCGFTRREVG